MPFYGDPYTLISSINKTGGISMSRSSGNLPAFVQVSADAITASGTTRPYETLEYSWDFGDPSGIESIYNPVTSGYVNPNTSQVGPEAAYVYRSTGVYTITLNIRGSGSGGYITDSGTTTFTALPYNVTTGHEFWYDSVSGSDANNGLSSGSPKETLDHLEYAFGASGYLHFARGGQYNLRNGVNSYYRTGLRVDAYGSGPKPVLKCCYTGGVEAGVQISIGSSPSYYYDIVWSDVEFRNMGLSSGEANRTIFYTISAGPDTSITDTYFDNCEINRSIDFPTSGVFSGIQRSTVSDSNFGLWKCSFNSGTGLYDYISGEYLGGEQLGDVDHEWTFFMGVAMSGGVGKADALGRATTHNIYTGSENHQLYRYCQIGADARDRLFCINGNINGYGNSGINFEGASGDPSVCHYWNISDNEFAGMWGVIDLGNQNNNSWTSGSIDDVVIEKNNIHDMSNMSDPPWPPTSGSQATYGSGINWANNDSWTFWASAGKKFTIRNNDFDPNLPRSTPKVASDIFGFSTYGSPRIYDNIVGNIINGTGYYVNPLLLSDNTTIMESGWEYNNFPEGYLNNFATFSGDTSGSGSEDGSAITGDLNVSDPDGITSPNFTITSSPVHGSGSINSSNGLWSYTPSADYNGSDSFTVRATDDLGNTETQVISLTISSVVDIANDSDTTNQNTPVTTSVLANDSFESTPVITSVTQGSNGTVSTNGTTTTYTPNTNFYGSDSYTYTVTSGGVTETATVNITVNQVSSGQSTMYFIAANNLIFTFVTG